MEHKDLILDCGVCQSGLNYYISQTPPIGKKPRVREQMVITIEVKDVTNCLRWIIGFLLTHDWTNYGSEIIKKITKELSWC